MLYLNVAGFISLALFIPFDNIKNHLKITAK